MLFKITSKKQLKSQFEFEIFSALFNILASRSRVTMAEEYKNASEEFKNVPEHETTPKISTTEEPSAEVKDRGFFDFLGKKKEEVKPQETTTPLESEFEHKAQISEPPAFVAKHEEEQETKENKPTLVEQLHQKHVEEEENKPSLFDKLHRSSSSSSSSSDEEGEDGEKRKKKKEKKKTVEGEDKTEEENKGVMDKIKEKFPHAKKTEDDHAPVVTGVPETEKIGMTEKIKEKLPGHGKKPEDSPVVDTAPVVETATPITAEHSAEHPAEKKGFLEKIKEKLPGHHAKGTEEMEKKEKESDA
ncbi:hypothetical protein EUTSA_v10008313mg [Eutrema salsugineum]|uniref:Dehydrin n=2 Tax=Eutrema salsugineum TaxID=72664 RepID=V4KTX6_EUTSA|nr:hypothetical protein EUTSA_v10008313mg [Eutrema salsugineum]